MHIGGHRPREVLKILREQVKTASGAFRTYMEIEMVADGPGTYIYEEI